ncbi:uncharacterized protein LOC133792123 [Humulus lupulus]|uniref:uncharacterized protein LOC133792123 n=1 Tax=Humulus lupulus TaxID=3486 RepID=UPI002B40EAF5|nr:uncharacterized protein LOC133792123 [Humulus lupulus]
MALYSPARAFYLENHAVLAKETRACGSSLVLVVVLLNDAEEKQLTEQNVKKWLDELKQVIYDADHVMDKINSETLRLKLQKGQTGSRKAKANVEEKALSWHLAMCIHAERNSSGCLIIPLVYENGDDFYEIKGLMPTSITT